MIGSRYCFPHVVRRIVWCVVCGVVDHDGDDGGEDNTMDQYKNKSKSKISIPPHA